MHFSVFLVAFSFLPQDTFLKKYQLEISQSIVWVVYWCQCYQTSVNKARLQLKYKYLLNCKSFTFIKNIWDDQSIHTVNSYSFNNQSLQFIFIKIMENFQKMKIHSIFLTSFLISKGSKDIVMFKILG